MISLSRRQYVWQMIVTGFLFVVLILNTRSSDHLIATEAVSSADLTEIPTPKWLPKPIENPAAEAADQNGMKAYTEHIPGTEVKLDLVPIPGGTFKMGSPASEAGHKDDEGPQIDVKISPFWMGKYEITWQQYELWGLKLDRKRRAVLKDAAITEWDKTADALANPTSPYSDMSFGMGKEGYPAICMTQFAAKMYCKWLSAKTGHYYRLPTEAEWEFACRAGKETAYSFGDDPKELKKYGWYGDSEDGSESGNSNEKYHKVGLKKPNPWGLFDMHGNVAEWCLDQYAPETYKNLAGGLVDNPLIPATKPYPHVVRGGSWIDSPESCRSAARAARRKIGRCRIRKFRKAFGIIPMRISSVSASSVRCIRRRPKKPPNMTSMPSKRHNSNIISKRKRANSNGNIQCECRG